MSVIPLNDDEFAREHRRRVIQMTKDKILRDSIVGPVRLEFERLPYDDPYDGITQRGNNIWMVDPEPRKKRTNPTKVEWAKNVGWTCGCRGWQGDRSKDCIHISRVRFMIGDGGAVPYDRRRRRLATEILYGTDEAGGKLKLADDTRRDKRGTPNR